MNNYLLFLLCLGFVANGQSTIQKNNDAGSNSLLTIGTYPVSFDEFNYSYSKNRSNNNNKGNKKEILEYVDRFVAFKLKIVEAKAMGIDTTWAFQEEYKTYRKELQQRYTSDAINLSKLVEEAYARMKEEISASHILIRLGQHASPKDTLKAFTKIVEIRRRIDKGERFDQLAQMFSEDPSAKENKGNLGYFSVFKMVFPFEDAAYSLQMHEVSQPVKTRFGYHLIKVEDRRPTRGKVEVSHILIRGSGDSIKTKIYHIYNQLQQGSPWVTLCKKYSQDGSTKEKGGRLKPFGVGDISSLPAFAQASFKIEKPHSISPPFQTAFGWHIVRLERKIPLPPFEDIAISLSEQMKRGDRMQALKLKIDNSRKKRLSFNEDEITKKQLIEKIDPILLKDNRSGISLNAPLFKIKDTVYKVNALLQYISRVTKALNIKGKPSNYIDELYNRFVDEKLDEAEDYILQRENANYKNTAREYKDGLLFFALMQEKIWSRVAKDTAGQQAYYEKNIQKYKTGIQIEAGIFSTSNKGHKEHLEAKMQQGTPLHKTDLDSMNLTSPFQVYKKNENEIIDAIDWTVGFHGVQMGETYYLVEVTRLFESRIEKYNEIIGDVILDYQDHLEKIWEANLKEKYPTSMNAKNKRRLLRQLKSY